MNASPKVLIVGGGIAGLCCALHLQKAGIACKILEAETEIGGRVKTQRYKGFLLDHGFQVLLTAYPEAKQVLDYSNLKLQRFQPGALVRHDGKFHHFVDPWRSPKHLFATAFSPLATWMDKLKVARLRWKLSTTSLQEILSRPETDTRHRLQQEGFSSQIADRFFKPFLGGIFLESELETSSRKFEFVFKMFSQGDAAIPLEGMGAIPEQIESLLEQGTIIRNAKVSRVDAQRVYLQDNEEELVASQVVLACEAPTALKLLGEVPSTTTHSQSAHGVHCLYYSADQSPVEEAILVLNGDDQGPINNLCVPTQLSSSYAPAGKSLISVTVLEGDDLNEGTMENLVRQQLTQWFGETVATWEHLKTFSIPYALPAQVPGPAQVPDSEPTPIQALANKHDVLLCGDYMENASLQGAMVSGRRIAEQIIRNGQGNVRKHD